MKNSYPKPQPENWRSRTVHLPGVETTGGLIAFEEVLRKVIQSTVSEQLVAIFESVRRLEATRAPASGTAPTLYRLPDMLDLLRVSKSTLYNWLNPSSRFHIPSLPRPFNLGGYDHGPVAWSASAVDSWVETRACAASENSSEAPAATSRPRPRSRTH